MGFLAPHKIKKRLLGSILFNSLMFNIVLFCLHCLSIYTHNVFPWTITTHIWLFWQKVWLHGLWNFSIISIPCLHALPGSWHFPYLHLQTSTEPKTFGIFKNLKIYQWNQVHLYQIRTPVHTLATCIEKMVCSFTTKWLSNKIYNFDKEKRNNT